ncbi:S27A1-like protein [Mya arenaria]|uniref:Long-chain-fatty-acid--CoA ligase n=1 Tax=Mya arenaria TaxID=6604 RepID=A0ABY7GA02_MYAAR|nr:S27A1-like protein [Mya arenaria]
MSDVFSVARSIRATIDGCFNMLVLKLVSFFLLGVFFSYYLGLSCTLTTLAVALKVLLTLKWAVKKYNQSGMSIPKLFQETVRKYPNKTCFIYENKTWTFQEVDLITNAIGNFFNEAGLGKGSVVALVMENRPELVFYWLGLGKIGAIGALINFNLREKSLLHCIQAAQAQGIVFSEEMTPAIAEISQDIPKSCLMYYMSSVACPIPGVISLDPLLEKSPTYKPPEPLTKFTDRLFYVYTSGTTGLPKAAIITHSRYYYMASAINMFLRITPEDVLYNALPLYHTAGGIIGTGQALLWGTTVVVKKKFSASRFWDDCIQYNCTAAQYIGEICRYLIAQPVKLADKQHRVRVMFGNGLQPGLWEDFQARFGVNIMGEFYGATEGNCNIINFDNTIGACGFTSVIAPFMYPVTLIKVDSEPGELVGRIVTGDPLRQFDGYVSKDATDKKVARDVFKKGDLAFLTGDTFRWRGENVSTFEVETTISKIIGLSSEGRAGMAAIMDPESKINLADLHKALHHSLPPYSRPLFIRLLDQAADTTGTHKLKKTTLQAEGFNPNVVKDRLFYMNTKLAQYESLTKSVYEDICKQKIRM